MKKMLIAMMALMLIFTGCAKKTDAVSGSTPKSTETE